MSKKKKKAKAPAHSSLVTHAAAMKKAEQPNICPELFKEFPNELNTVIEHYNLNPETLTEDRLCWHLLRFCVEETKASTLSLTGGDPANQLCYIIKYRRNARTSFCRGQ